VIVLITDNVSNIDDALAAAQAVIQYLGMAAFAISAALLAGRRRMTVVGVVVFSVIVATGGGTIRDILLGDLPVYWVADPRPLLVAAVAAGVTIPLVKIGGLSLVQRYSLVRLFDTAGLALFTIVGTNAALESGADAFAAIVVGVITGVGGGMIRDTIAGRIPEVLASGHMYATAALTGSALNVLLLNHTDLAPTLASSMSVVAIFALRLLAARYGWGVPQFSIAGERAASDTDERA
jgi:uncharacterized membrane protein YeiH